MDHSWRLIMQQRLPGSALRSRIDSSCQLAPSNLLTVEPAAVPEIRERFDRNPVAAVRQRPEPPGRDRIVSPAEFRALWDKAKGDREMRAFLALAGTTTMRKGEILSLRWDRVHLNDSPYATLVRTKTGHQRHVPIPQSIVKTFKALSEAG